MSAFTDEVAKSCLAQWETFKRGKAKEWWDPQFGDVARYWKKLGITRDGRENITFELNADGSLKLDPVNHQPVPRSPKKTFNRNPPWSAAFISWIAREAGAGTKFKYRAYHSFYIMAALREAALPASTAPWIARQRDAYTPKVGDLIACGRDRAKTATFSTAASFIDNSVDVDFFPSHTDFVVEVKSDKVVTVGGNVGDSVGRKNWPLDTDHFIGEHDPQTPTASVICIMQCGI
jgi:hypothetical protein